MTSVYKGAQARAKIERQLWHDRLWMGERADPFYQLSKKKQRSANRRAMEALERMVTQP